MVPYGGNDLSREQFFRTVRRKQKNSRNDSTHPLLFESPATKSQLGGRQRSIEREGVEHRNKSNNINSNDIENKKHSYSSNNNFSLLGVFLLLNRPLICCFCVVCDRTKDNRRLGLFSLLGLNCLSGE